MKKLSKFFIFFLTLSYQASTMAINSEKSSPLFSPSLINHSNNFCPISKPHLSSSHPTSAISFEDLNRHVILYRPPPTTPPPKGVSLGVAIAGWSLAAVLLLVLLALLYCIHHLRNQLALQNQTAAHQAPQSPQPSSTVPASNKPPNQTVQAAAHQNPTTSIEVEDITGPSEGESEVGPFTFAELEAATNGFSERVGRGGCGSVYRGRLDDGRDVAVKVLKQVPGAEAAFDREIQLLEPIRSENVAALLGHLSYGTRRMLVYEFVPNHTLDYHLHDESAAPLFTWERRMRAAIGVARGLIALHDRNLIHRDIKPANILMDHQFNPKIIDFGSVKHLDEADDGALIVCGTHGYWDPEYAQLGNLSQLVDVYSFGVVLLELVAGRRPILPDPDPGIVYWAEPLIAEYEKDQAKVVDLVDQRLQGAYDNIQLEQMISTAKDCVKLKSILRPKTMREVLEKLQGASSSQQS